MGKKVPKCALPTFFKCPEIIKNRDYNLLFYSNLEAERPGFEPGKRF